MTQIKLAVAAELAGPDSTECPFDCSCTCDATNEFERVGKMGENLTNGVPTIRYKKTDTGNFENNTTPIKPKYPPRDKSFPNDWGWAAHHLIPVGSLKDHALRNYLDKSANASEVSCNAGYDVNGVTNGKWLIGSSEMQKSLKDDSWVRSEVIRTCEGHGIEVGESLYSTLSGNAKTNSEDKVGFKEWLFATMIHYQLQFHDSHSATDGYNDFVKEILNKVEANLKRLNEKCPGGDDCKTAGKKPKAPHRITHRLDDISRRLEGYLSGPPENWHDPIFTSEFSRMLAEEVQSNN